MNPIVVTSVSRSPKHGFSKHSQPSITLIKGLGVDGDAHKGRKVQHLYHMSKNPNAPNLCQVHLIHDELFDDLRAQGFDIGPALLGENITTRGLNILDLPLGTKLRIGAQAEVTLTGLRSPCVKIETAFPGMLKHLIGKNPDGGVDLLCGVMSVVSISGEVKAGDPIYVMLPDGQHVKLEKV